LYYTFVANLKIKFGKSAINLALFEEWVVNYFPGKKAGCYSIYSTGFSAVWLVL
jgi:hypothetical protein